MQSAGDAISRVGAVALEVTTGTLKLPYVGAASCDDIVGNLSASGFSSRPPLHCMKVQQHSEWAFYRSAAPVDERLHKPIVKSV